MRKSPTSKNPQTTNPKTLNKALYNKELFYYLTQNSKSSKINKKIYEEAEKILANLDTIYFDLNKEEKKLYKQVEKIIINYNIQK